MDPAPWKAARVTGAELQTLSLEALTSELGLSQILAKKAVREINHLMSSASDSPAPPKKHARSPSPRASPIATAGGSRAKRQQSVGYLGYIIAALAVFSHLVWHPSITSDFAGATTSRRGAMRSGMLSSVVPEYAILTMYTDTIAGYAEQATLVKQLYCLRHGYQLIVERALPSASDLSTAFAGSKAGARERHPSWAKLYFIQKHLWRAKFLVWMDADALVMDLRVPLSVITSRTGDLTVASGKKQEGAEVCALWACQDQELVAAQDWRARNYLGVSPIYLINAGVLVFRSGAEAENIVKSAWNMGNDDEFIPKKYDMYYAQKPKQERGWPWEQGALWELLSTSPKARAATCVYRHAFNKLTTPLTEWDKETFVFHMTDWSDTDRARYSGAVLQHHLNPEANRLPRIERA